MWFSSMHFMVFFTANFPLIESGRFQSRAQQFDIVTTLLNNIRSGEIVAKFNRIAVEEMRFIFTFVKNEPIHFSCRDCWLLLWYYTRPNRSTLTPSFLIKLLTQIAAVQALCAAVFLRRSMRYIVWILWTIYWMSSVIVLVVIVSHSVAQPNKNDFSHIFRINCFNRFNDKNKIPYNFYKLIVQLYVQRFESQFMLYTPRLIIGIEFKV